MQVQPRGLLSFLQIKNEARSPSALDEKLLATLDLSTWYLETNSEVVEDVSQTVPIGINGSGTFPALVVPPQQCWYVSQFLVSFTAGAGATVTGGRSAAYVRFGAARTTVQVGEAVTLAATLRDHSVFARPLFLQPDDALGWSVVNNVVAVATLAGRARICRLGI